MTSFRSWASPTRRGAGHRSRRSTPSTRASRDGDAPEPTIPPTVSARAPASSVELWWPFLEEGSDGFGVLGRLPAFAQRFTLTLLHQQEIGLRRVLREELLGHAELWSCVGTDGRCDIDGDVEELVRFAQAVDQPGRRSFLGAQQ